MGLTATARAGAKIPGMGKPSPRKGAPHRVTIAERHLREVRDFVAYAVRSGYGTKAARKRMVNVCEHVLLRALLRDGEA